MELRFAPLFSGSSGNSIYVGNGNTNLLVDAGVAAARILDALKGIGVAPGSLDALLVTHEHSDHIKGVGILSRKLDLPVYATNDTWCAMEGKIGAVSPKNKRVISAEQDFYLGDINVTPFSIPHDAADPVGYRFDCGGARFCIATDIGYVREQWMQYILGCDAVMLESNYDPAMLAAGSYPYVLKQRISSRKGHLSNDDAGAAAVRLAEKGTELIILSHLSKENNFPELALQTVSNVLSLNGYVPGEGVDLLVAMRSETTGLFSIRSDYSC